MARSSFAAAILSAILLVGLLPFSAMAATPPPLPGSIAAVGDSISQAASSGGSLGTDYPANSWSTGTNSTVNSHYLRLLALNGGISGHADNRSVSGAKMVNLNSQMQGVVTAQPDYLTVLIGGNDLCTDTTAQMTSVTSFRGQFIQAMDTLAAGSPGTRVFVASIPDVYQLWALFNSSFWARTVWSLGSICQSLLANPRSTATADVQRRAEVAQRNVDYNTVLAEVCALYAQCRFDDNAVYDVQFSRSDVSGDYFHPSIAGQAKLSAVTWAASYWPNGGPAPDAPPTAAFSTVSCTELTCSFDASGSSDDGGISGYAWTFGDGGSSTGVAASHTFSGDGTWDVTLEVTDTAGQTDSVTHQVTVSQSGGGTTIHLASGSGTSTARKGGWTATVSVSARDGDGAPVANATISGSWSTGGSDSCLTAADGACSFSQNMNKKVTTATWTITGITAAGYAYDSGSDAGSPVTVSAP